MLKANNRPPGDLPNTGVRSIYLHKRNALSVITYIGYNRCAYQKPAARECNHFSCNIVLLM